MFTGIIKGIGKIINIKNKHDIKNYTIEFPSNLLNGLEIGASVANNGVCLTVVKIYKNLVSFDLIKETLKTTNLGESKIGKLINLERALKLNDEIGGHLICGHVITIAKIIDIIKYNHHHKLIFQIYKFKYMKYLLEKGFIAIDGISLTLAKIYDNKFIIYIIPETIKKTILYMKNIGDTVNIEIDFYTQSIINYTENILKNYLSKIDFNLN